MHVYLYTFRYVTAASNAYVRPCATVLRARAILVPNLFAAESDQGELHPF